MSVTITAQTLIAGQVEHEIDAAPPIEIWLGEQIRERASSSLPQVAPGPWRSLGRYLDYTNWADRDRFVELDRAIEANAQLDEIEEPIEEPVSWSSTLDSDYTPSPFSSWGVRPIGGGHFRNNRRRRFIQ